MNPSETITSEKYAQQIDKIHQKLQCLQLALFNRTGPVLLHHITCPLIAQPTLQKLSKLGYELLPHLPYSPDLLTTDYHFFKHLNILQGKCFHNQQDAESAFQEFIKSRSMDFSVRFNSSVVSDSVRPHGLQHTRLPCPSTLRAHSNLCPLSW